eukprot:scaffold102074_cov33-Phaeocystis_antarctica.AAC.1
MMSELVVFSLVRGRVGVRVRGRVRVRFQGLPGALPASGPGFEARVVVVAYRIRIMRLYAVSSGELPKT